MMAKNSLAAKKQEERNLEKIKDLLRLPENKKCFDCPTRSPFFVNLSIQTFICARCSGLVREVGHRIKSISTSKFSDAEVIALQCTGNQVARTIWLSKLLFHQDTEEPETDGDVRLFMRQKYYEQKWLDREKAVSHVNYIKKVLNDQLENKSSKRTSTLLTTPQATTATTPPRADTRPTKVSINTERTAPLPAQAEQNASPLSPNRLLSLIDCDDHCMSPTSRHSLPPKSSTMITRPSFQPTPSWIDEHVPVGLIPTLRNNDSKNEHLLPIHRTSTSLNAIFTSSDNNKNSGSSCSHVTAAPLPSSPTVSGNNPIFKDLAQLNSMDQKTSSSSSGGSTGVLKPTSTSYHHHRHHSSNSPSPTISSSFSSITSMPSTPYQQQQQQQQQTFYYCNPAQLTHSDPYAALRTVTSSSPPNVNKHAAPGKIDNAHLFRDLDPLFHKNV